MGLSRRSFLSACGATGLALAGCRRGGRDGLDPLPPGVERVTGRYQDVCPRWSPDGTRIAFLRATSDRHYQLFSAPVDLRSAQALVQPFLINPDLPLRVSRTGHFAPDGLAWSPDGSWIAFPRVEWFNFDDGSRAPGTALWRYDLRLRNVALLAAHPKKYEGDLYAFASPAWSPDGKRLAFVGEEPDGASGLFLRDLRIAETEMDRPRPDRYDDAAWPAWSPDGGRLVFRQGILRKPTADRVETLRLIQPGGREARNLLVLTPRDFGRLGVEFAEGVSVRIGSPVWSPDGTRIAFTLTPRPLDRIRYAVFILEVGGNGALRRVSPPDGKGYHAPVWLDNESLGAIRPSSGGMEVVELDPRGMSRARWICRLPTDDFDWSPDRTAIVCGSLPADERNRTNERSRLLTIKTGIKPV